MPLALVGALAASVTGCGESTIPAERRAAGGTDAQQTPVPARPTLSPTDWPATDEPTPTGTATGPATNIVEPDPNVVDLRPVRWRSAEPARTDSRVLLVDFETRGEPCDVLGAVDVDQADDVVTVTLLTGRQPTADCPEDEEGESAELVTTAAVLTRPLGGRTVRDGAAG